MYKHWKHMFEPKHDTGAIVGAGILGAVAGAAIAYWLYATEAGADKRTKLSKVGKTLKKHASDIKDEVKETMADTDDVLDDLDDDEGDDDE